MSILPHKLGISKHTLTSRVVLLAVAQLIQRLELSKSVN